MSLLAIAEPQSCTVSQPTAGTKIMSHAPNGHDSSYAPASDHRS